MGNHLTNYEKGRLLEKKVLDYFRYHGFVGLRAAQSKGPYDVMVSPPFYTESPLTLHIQCGPKTEEYLDKLLNIALKHSGLKAHLYKENHCEPKISLLNHDNYISLQEFLTLFYGIKMPAPWKQALQQQAKDDRDTRMAKKLLA